MSMPEKQGYERKTDEKGEVHFQCRWCPCLFCTEEDARLHLKALGETEAVHRDRWRTGVAYSRKWQQETE